MTWLLSQGERLPAILAGIVVGIFIARQLFARREEMAAIKQEIQDLRQRDDQHMGSVTRAHSRIDEWTHAVHSDMVALFEREEQRRDHQKEQVRWFGLGRK